MVAFRVVCREEEIHVKDNIFRYEVRKPPLEDKCYRRSAISHHLTFLFLYLHYNPSQHTAKGIYKNNSAPKGNPHSTKTTCRHAVEALSELEKNIQ